MDKNSISSKGILNPVPSTLLIKMIDNLIIIYSKYDRCTQGYELYYDDLNDFDRHELASIIISYDENRASEATGPDNKQYENYMLPSLITFMRDVTNKDLKNEFVEAWTIGVSSYFKDYLSILISDRLVSYNMDKFGRTGNE